jgi:hypothetical protein
VTPAERKTYRRSTLDAAFKSQNEDILTKDSK